MRVSGKWMPILLFCCAVMARTTGAQACGSIGCGDVRDVQPADGAVDVPLNAELRVRYFGSMVSSCRESPTQVQLSPNGTTGARIESGTVLSFPDRAEDWLIVKPKVSLLPDTRYVLSVRGLEGDWERVSAFTTGSESDLEAPELTPVSALSFLPRNTSSTDCGHTDVVPFVPKPAVASDASGDTRYNVYVDDELTGPYRDSLEQDQDGAELYVDCGTEALFTGVLIQPGSHLEIRAVDLAGNESPPGDSVRVLDRCSASSDVESSGGCNLSAVRGRTGAAWLFALLAAFAAREARAIKRRSLARKTSNPEEAEARRCPRCGSSRPRCAVVRSTGAGCTLRSASLST
jgi:hypothetical protein